MASLVSVVIPTCGNKDYFIAALQSIISQTYHYWEVVLVDNSMAGVVGRRARDIYPAAQVYAAADNLFYCGGMNKGIELSRGEFVLCLNDDVVLDPGFIQEALAGFAVDSRIGMVSGKLLRTDHKTLDSTGLFLTPWRTARERGYGQADKGQFDQREFVFGVSGAAAFYRKKMLDDIRAADGWFDPAFRMFYEDMDVAWRANRHGWRAYYMPTAVAYHVRGGTVRSASGAGKKEARHYLSDEFLGDLIKNRYRMIIKNETWWGFCLHIFPVLLYELGVWAYIFFYRPRVVRIFWSRRGCLRSAFRMRDAGT